MQFFLIALMFAVASFIYIVLQAPPSLSPPEIWAFLLDSEQGSRSTHKSLSRTQEWGASDSNEVFCTVI